MATLNVGELIPDFSLQDQFGNTFDSKGYRGKKLVIYFYPKDNSLVCTREACAFRDSFADFTDAGAVVAGINSAPPETHARFAADHRLPYILLSDTGNKVLKSFGVRPALFLSGRETFLIDENGIVLFKYRAFFDGAGHPEKLLNALKANTK
jgi:peroxiredoxin Q/BCP